VAMSPQVTHETPSLGHLPRAEAVAHASSPFHIFVGTHVIDERNETMVQHGEVTAQDFFGSGARRSLGFHGIRFRWFVGAEIYHPTPPIRSARSPMGE
jgi:hypothetical protein